MQKSSLFAEKIEIPKEQIEFTGGVGGHTVQGQTRTTRMPDSPEVDGRLEVSLLLEHDPDLEVEGVSAWLHHGPVLKVPAGDQLEPLLVLLLVLKPAEDDLHA